MCPVWEMDIPKTVSPRQGSLSGPWLQDRAVLAAHGGTFSITGARIWHHCSEQLLSLLPTKKTLLQGTHNGHMPLSTWQRVTVQPSPTPQKGTELWWGNPMLTTSLTSTT